jgi:hypothetical protein
MPRLGDTFDANLENYKLAPIISTPSIVAETATTQQTRNVYVRCPLPQIWQSNTDSLRQTFTTMVPQRRLFIPK